jgi:HAD superfamily hydrolase (TIGR01509 family)
MKTASHLMKRYDAYLFDYDGTLANSHPMWLEIVRKQLGRYSLAFSDQQLVEKVFGRYDEGMRELGVPEQDLPELGREVLDFANKHMPLVGLYPGAREVLQQLKAMGRKRALITATHREVIEVALVKQELQGMFDTIVTGNEMRAQKPDPDGVLKALKALRVLPENAVMIGDSKKDVLAGQNAGTDTLLFYPPEHETQHDLHELRGHQPTYIIHSWREMLDQLQ